jgi:hypothetical protein
MGKSWFHGDLDILINWIDGFLCVFLLFPSFPNIPSETTEAQEEKGLLSYRTQHMALGPPQICAEKWVGCDGFWNLELCGREEPLKTKVLNPARCLRT